MLLLNLLQFTCIDIALDITFELSGCNYFTLATFNLCRSLPW